MVSDSANSGESAADLRTPTVVSQSTSDGQTRGESSVSEIERGTTLGRYIVLERLGTGGMGVVYRAYDPELERKVALKVVKAKRRDDLGNTEGEHVSSQMRSRLLREAQALAKLTHPNVITVYDVGTVDGDVFIAMAYVDGKTVDQWIGDCNPGWRRIVDIFLMAGRGLAAAHRAGLTHRDFKPGNVMVDATGQVYVLDFGLAHARPGSPVQVTFAPIAEVEPIEHSPDVDWSNTELGDDTQATETVVLTARTPAANSETVDGSSLAVELTEFGTIMGTPSYMAPEQHHGQQTDARSDQFSFCVALYEALYRERPYRGRTANEIRRAMVSGVVSIPSQTHGVPAWLRRTVLKGLASDPCERYATMEPLLEALARDSRKLRRRVLASVGIGAMAMASVVSYIRAGQEQQAFCSRGEDKLAQVWNDTTGSDVHAAFTSLLPRLGNNAYDAARPVIDKWGEDWTTMYRGACEATRVWGEQSEELLDTRMSCLDGRLRALRELVALWRAPDPRVIERAAYAAYGLPSVSLCGDLQALRAQIPPPEDPEHRNEAEKISKELARLTAAKHSAHFQESSGKIVKLIERADALGYAPLVAEASNLLGYAKQSSGQAQAALKLHLKALHAAESVGASGLAVTASLGVMWNHVYQLRRFDLAEFYVNHTRSLLELAGPSPMDESTLATLEAIIAEASGKRAESIAHDRRCLAIRREHLDPDHPTIDAALNNLAIGLTSPRAADMEEAVSLFEEAIDRRLSAWPDGHPFAAVYISNMGNALAVGGHPNRALAVQRRSVELNAKLGQSGSPRGRRSLERLAHAYHQLGLNRDALEHYAAAVERVMKPQIDCSEGDIYRGVPGLVDVYLDLGMIDTAVSVASRALGACRRHLGENHNDTADLSQAVARAHLAAGDPDAAETFIQQRQDVVDSTAGETETELERLALANLWGVLHRARGELDQALKHHQEAHSGTGAVFGAAHPQLVYVSVQLARTHLARREAAAARRLLVDAVDRLALRLGEGSPRLVEPLAYLAQALLAEGEPQAARSVLTRALDNFVPQQTSPAVATQLKSLQARIKVVPD